MFLFKTDRYIKSYVFSSNDGPVEPSVELEDMVIKVCDDLGESISEHTVVRPVLIPGTHTIHAGTLGTMQGGLIGLPSFFEFNKVEEIDGKIQVCHIRYTISSNKTKF